MSEREYNFSLILSSVTELTDDQAEKLFEAGCDDATPSVIYGRVWLEFSRMATSKGRCAVRYPRCPASKHWGGC